MAVRLVVIALPLGNEEAVERLAADLKIEETRNLRVSERRASSASSCRPRRATRRRIRPERVQIGVLVQGSQ